MDMYYIYQLKQDDSTRDLRFENLEYIHKRGYTVNRDNYELVYSKPMTSADTPENIYEEFNLHPPADFKGHSLSVSDIIVYKSDEKEQAFFCDRVGFKEVPEFFAEKDKDIASMEPSDEKDYRLPNTETDNTELDIVTGLAFDIDELFRNKIQSYKNDFPFSEFTKEKIADDILQAKAAAYKGALISLNCAEADTLLKCLCDYEKEYPKNHFTIYRLKDEYKKTCKYTVSAQRKNDGGYIKRDMYIPVFSEPIDEWHKPMRIEFMQIVNNDALVPDLRDIIGISYNGAEKTYFRQLQDYVEVPEFNGVPIRAAVKSNYKGYTAFIGTDDKVYLGRNSSYLFNEEKGFLPVYDNADNSLIFISDNQKMFSFLNGAGWCISQQEMINKGFFQESDYAEFAELQNGLLLKLEKTQDLEFDGEPFTYPDYNRDKKPSIRRQLAENKTRTAEPNKEKSIKKEDLSL